MRSKVVKPEELEILYRAEIGPMPLAFWFSNSLGESLPAFEKAPIAESKSPVNRFRPVIWPAARS